MNWAASHLSSGEELYKTGGIYMPKGKEWIVSGLGHLRVRIGLGLCVRLPHWCWLENCRLIKTTLLGDGVFKLGTWSWFAQNSWLHLGPFVSFFSSVQLSLVAQLCLTLCRPWTAACQASLPSQTCRAWSNSSSSSQLSNHLTLCRLLLLLSSIFPSIRVFSKSQFFSSGGQSIGSFHVSIGPSNEYWGLISFRIDWLELLAVQGTLKSLLQHHSSKASILLHSAVFIVQLSHPYMTTGNARAWLDRPLSAKYVSGF